jgi:hypothetical protein
MSIAGKFFVHRATHAARVANRRRRRALEHELAAYSSAADRADLEAILDRYPDGVTQEMRDILAFQHSQLPRRARHPYRG